jgi:AraC-like DNA-binding protein
MSKWEGASGRAAASADLIAPLRSFSADGALHLLEALGGDSEALCRVAEIDHARLREPDYRVEKPSLVKLFAIAARRGGDPLIGLHAAQRARLGSLAAHLVASQATVADALAVRSRVQTLLLGAPAVALCRVGEMTYVTLETGLEPESARHLTEYCIASDVRFLGWLTLQAARPTEVHFRHRCAGDVAEYERFFACRVEFEASEDGAALSAATMAEPLVSANDELAAQLELLVRSELDKLPSIAFSERINLALRAGRMQAGDCRRDVIARRLGVSMRTLQRRLEDEGTTFGDIVDGARRQLALEMMANPAVSIAGVGSIVGYADQYAFNKAFKRWTGRSPSAYRRELLDHGASDIAARSSGGT